MKNQLALVPELPGKNLDTSRSWVCLTVMQEPVLAKI